MLWQSLIAAKVYGIPTTNGLIRELRRTSVERVNSRLKKHLCLDDQHIRGLAKTQQSLRLVFADASDIQPTKHFNTTLLHLAQCYTFHANSLATET
jgi:hypothetical protein